MKKGMIDKYGVLQILRGSVLKIMECPLAGIMEVCCDNCPLFGEPEPWRKGATLELCQAVLRFDDFEDLR